VNQRMALRWPRWWALAARVTVEWCHTMLVAWGLVIRARLGGSEAIVTGNEIRTRVEGGG